MGKKTQKTREGLREDRRGNVEEEILGFDLNGVNRSPWAVGCAGDSSERYALS